MCHVAGQTRSTALVLKYGTNDWNALHRDLYGELVFPLRVVINLSEPHTEYTGGEFMLVEQRPRAQSRGSATQLRGATVTFSPPATGLCAQLAAGRHHRCATASPSSTRASATPSG